MPQGLADVTFDGLLDRTRTHRSVGCGFHRIDYATEGKRRDVSRGIRSEITQGYWIVIDPIFDLLSLPPFSPSLFANAVREGAAEAAFGSLIPIHPTSKGRAGYPAETTHHFPRGDRFGQSYDIRVHSVIQSKLKYGRLTLLMSNVIALLMSNVNPPTRLSPEQNSQTDWADSPTPDLSFITGKGPLPPVPPFPIQLLGRFWESYICDHAGGELPRDYFAMSLLGTVAGLIGNSCEAAMPSPSTFVQPATLWAINVGLPSSGKTPAFKPFVRIVDDLEAQTDLPIKVEDATVAGTIDALFQSPNGIMVMNDELSGWWNAFSRDRQGEAFWLKAWNGDSPYTHRRKGTCRVIPRHNISVVGATQPATLSTMIQATGGVEKGFVSRCMFSFPDPVRGQIATGNYPDERTATKILGSIHSQHAAGLTIKLPVADEAAAHHKAWWNAMEERLLPDPTVPEGQWIFKQRGNAIRLALLLEVLWAASGQPPSAKVAKRYRDLVAMSDPATNDNAPQRDVAQRKLDKLCETDGLYAAPYHPAGGPAGVSIRAMKAATDLIENYFHAHFCRCEAFAYKPVNEEAAIALCRELVVKDMSEFNARELRQYAYGKVHTVLHGNAATAAVKEVCDLLVERHILRESGTSSSKGGRKASVYEVNPKLKVMGKRALLQRRN